MGVRFWKKLLASNIRICEYQTGPISCLFCCLIFVYDLLVPKLKIDFLYYFSVFYLQRQILLGTVLLAACLFIVYVMDFFIVKY